MKAFLEVIKFNVSDVVTTSPTVPDGPAPCGGVDGGDEEL